MNLNQIFNHVSKIDCFAGVKNGLDENSRINRVAHGFFCQVIRKFFDSKFHLTSEYVEITGFSYIFRSGDQLKEYFVESEKVLIETQKILHSHGFVTFAVPKGNNYILRVDSAQ